MTGIEPVTQGFSVLCSTNWATSPFISSEPVTLPISSGCSTNWATSPFFRESAKVEIFSLHQNSLLGFSYCIRYLLLYLLNIALNFRDMNLTIDAGNTFVKAVIFDKDNIKWMRTYKNFSASDLKSIFKNPVDGSILSSVAHIEKKIVRFLKSLFKF